MAKVLRRDQRTEDHKIREEITAESCCRGKATEKQKQSNNAGLNYECRRCHNRKRDNIACIKRDRIRVCCGCDEQQNRYREESAHPLVYAQAERRALARVRSSVWLGISTSA